MNSNEKEHRESAQAVHSGNTGEIDLFPGGGRLEVHEDIQQAIAERLSILVITGDEGSGKTILCEQIVGALPVDCVAVHFKRTVESFEDVLRELAAEVGVTEVDVSRNGRAATIERIHSAFTRQHKRAVIVFDGAEQIYLATLEHIRKMLDMLNEKGVTMQMVLVGRPLLIDNLKQLEICNFNDVPEKRYVLGPLSQEETAEYITFYTGRKAGADSAVTSEIIDKIYQASGGNLKKIEELTENYDSGQKEDASFWVLLESIASHPADTLAGSGRKWLARLGSLNFAGKRTILAITALCGVMFLAHMFSGDPEIDPQKDDITIDYPESVRQPEVDDSFTQPQPPASVATAPQILPIPVDEKIENSVPAWTDEPLQNEKGGGKPDQERIAARGEYQTQQNEDDLPSMQHTDPFQPLDPLDPLDTHITSEPQKTDEHIGSAGQAEKDGVPDEQVDTAFSDEGDEVESELQAQQESGATPDKVPVILSTETKRLVGTDSDSPSGGTIVISSLTESSLKKVKYIRGKQPKRVVVDPEGSEDIGGVNEPSVKDREQPVAMQSDSDEESVVRVTPESTVADSPINFGSAKGKEDRIRVPVVSEAIIPSDGAVGSSDLYNSRIAAGRPWRVGSKNDRYTIQLMVLSSDPAHTNIKRILSQKDYSENSENLYIFQKEDNPATVFVFYGEYANMTEARNARNSIPSFLRKHKPYVLSVQNAMRKLR